MNGRYISCRPVRKALEAIAFVCGCITFPDLLQHNETTQSAVHNQHDVLFWGVIKRLQERILTANSVYAFQYHQLAGQ